MDRKLKRRSLHRSLWVAIASMCAVAAESGAVDRLWNREIGGTFSVPGNWTGGVVAGTIDSAVFGISGGRGDPFDWPFTYTVGFSANAANFGLRVPDDIVTFDLNGRTYSTTSAPATNSIGSVSGSLGRLTLTDGTWDLADNSQLLIGSTAGATGSLIVTTFGILTDGNIIVGQAGSGNFTVTTGGVANVDSVLIANAPGVKGTAILSGASVWTTTGQVVVGVAGDGTFTMNGGQMNSGSAVLGAASGSTGTATLVDGQWQLGAGSMIVGNDGDGQLNITSSAQVLNGNASIGELVSGGVVMVDGVDSQWISSGTFHVGKTGAGRLEVKNGGLVQVTGAAGGDIATLANSTGLVRVNTGSRWTNTGALRVGERGRGDMFVESGGLVESAIGFLGSFTGGFGTAVVSGPNSRWINLGFLRVADQGRAELVISRGGLVGNTSAVIGLVANSDGTAFVTDSGSRWNHSSSLVVGGSGHGFLVIAAGGTVENTVGFMGDSANGVGSVLVDGPGSLWDNSGDLLVGVSGAARLEIGLGGRVNNANGVVGSNATATGDVFVRDPGSLWNNTGVLTVGGFSADVTPTATVTVTAGGEVRSAGGIIGKEQGSIALVTVSDPGSQWINSAGLTVGEVGTGELRILNGALVQNQSASIGGGAFFSSKALVDGANSRWINNGNLVVAAGVGCELIISNGGTVQSAIGVVGLLNFDGEATVKDPGSVWTISDGLQIGTTSTLSGANTLNVLAGGTVSVGTNLRIIKESTVNLAGGTINIGGLFELAHNLNNVFNFTAGTLRFTGDVVLEDFRLTDILGPSHTIGTLQHVAVAGKPTLEGLLRIDGGTFSAGSLPVGAPVDFNSGTFNLTSDNLVIGPGGLFGDTLSLSNRNVNVTNATTIQPGARLLMQGGAFSAGALLNQGTIDFQNQSSQVSGGLLTNTGTIRGQGTILNAIQNNAAGQIQTTAGQRLEFGGAVTNAGTISLVGGQMQFNALVTNAASTGLISVRDGIVRFLGGLTNNGTLAVTIGTSDVYGDINNPAGGRIIVSGGALATFYEDIANNGSISVSASGPTRSTAIFLGSLSGNGISGGGQVFIEGDARPGFSPGNMAFGGDLSFGPGASLKIEIGGTTPGTQFDRLQIAQSAFLDGNLNLSLINGFNPTAAQDFTILTAAAIDGRFANALDTVTFPGGRFDVTYTPTTVILGNFTSINIDSQWNVDSGGSWGNPANWSAGMPDAIGTTARFLSIITAPRTITLDASRTAGRLVFDNANSYTITSPGSLTLNNGPSPASIDVLQGSHVINASISLASDTTVNIAAGAMLNVKHIRGEGLTLSSGRLNILSNGTDDGTSKLTSLNIAPGATLDLNNNDLIIEQGDVAAISALVASARAGGTWTGDGLTSSAAKANDLTGLGVIANNDGSGAPLHTVFSGQNVALDDVLIKYTWNGDTELNGIVDADDYFRTDIGFASGGALDGWISGDFDYSGGIDADDYFLIDAAFAGQTGPLGAAASVPEPGVMGVAVGVMGWLARRRRRSSSGWK